MVGRSRSFSLRAEKHIEHVVLSATDSNFALFEINAHAVAARPRAELARGFQIIHVREVGLSVVAADRVLSAYQAGKTRNQSRTAEELTT